MWCHLGGGVIGQRGGSRCRSEGFAELELTSGLTWEERVKWVCTASCWLLFGLHPMTLPQSR